MYACIACLLPVLYEDYVRVSLGNAMKAKQSKALTSNVMKAKQSKAKQSKAAKA